jgi:YesN/AraC family two-component response regulator
MNNEKDERKYHLLIVDDEESFRLLLEDYFKQEIPGIKIELARDGEEAYNLALKFRLHIIWTCIKMPHMNGLELMKLIKENPDIQDAKVIVFSGYSSKEIKNQAFGLGADAFLHKGDYDSLEEGAKIVAKFLEYDPSFEELLIPK